MERWRKLHGRRLDHEERARKREARGAKKASEDAQKLTGLRAKLYQKKRHHEKIQIKKQIKAHVSSTLSLSIYYTGTNIFVYRRSETSNRPLQANLPAHLSHNISLIGRILQMQRPCRVQLKIKGQRRRQSSPFHFRRSKGFQRRRCSRL
jgi:hypothetical protein